MENKEVKHLTDEELDHLLSFATKPDLPSHFGVRVMDSLTAQSNVIVFKPAQSSRLQWLLGLPVAASLVLGIWIGASGNGSDFWPTTNTVQQSENIFATPTAIDDLNALLEENQS